MIRSVDGEIYVSGDNKYGQLAREKTIKFSNKFNRVDLPPATRALVMSESFIAEVGNDLYTWGWNEHGNLGTGDRTDKVTPVKI